MWHNIFAFFNGSILLVTLGTHIQILGVSRLFIKSIIVVNSIAFNNLPAKSKYDLIHVSLCNDDLTDEDPNDYSFVKNNGGQYYELVELPEINLLTKTTSFVLFCLKTLGHKSQ